MLEDYPNTVKFPSFLFQCLHLSDTTDLPLPALLSGKGFQCWRGWFLFFGQKTGLLFHHCSAQPQSILAPGCPWLSTHLYGYRSGFDGHLKCFVPHRNASSTAKSEFFWRCEVFFPKNSSPSLIFCIPWRTKLSQAERKVCWRGEEHKSLCLLLPEEPAPATKVPFHALFPQKKALWATQTHIINYPTEGVTQNSLNVSIPVIP